MGAHAAEKRTTNFTIISSGSCARNGSEREKFKALYGGDCNGKYCKTSAFLLKVQS